MDGTTFLITTACAPEMGRASFWHTPQRLRRQANRHRPETYRFTIVSTNDTEKDGNFKSDWVDHSESGEDRLDFWGRLSLYIVSIYETNSHQS